MKPFIDLPRALLLEVAARAGLQAAADHAAATGNHVLLLWDDLNANERTHLLATCESVLTAPVALEGAELAFETTVRGVLRAAGMPIVARAAYVRPAPVAVAEVSAMVNATADGDATDDEYLDHDGAESGDDGADEPPVLRAVPPPPVEMRQVMTGVDVSDMLVSGTDAPPDNAA